MPSEVKPIFKEVAARFELLTGSHNKTAYDWNMNWLKKNITVTSLPADVRQNWAQKLAKWPQAHANKLEKEGLPAVKILNATLNAAEGQGYKWPVRYVVK